jgi:phosphatidylserine/phosphatidylglycerophosphate/cardiolipin synthase-like enzyme
MFSRIFNRQADVNNLASSTLYNQGTFYEAFVRDLNRCKHEVIIESPFITGKRIASLLPIFSKMRSQGVRITINTRPPSVHEAPFDYQAEQAIEDLQAIGVSVLITGGHHRKLAIMDNRVLYEGSLNILSQNDSCEIMRRIDSQQLAKQMIDFIKIAWFLR